MGGNRRQRGRGFLIALALLASCSQSRVDVAGPGDTRSDTAAATTTVAIPPSTVTSTTAAPSTTLAPSKLWRPLARRAQVVPAFVAFVDESGRTVGIKPTLGTAPATIVYRVLDGSTIDGLSVTADGTAVLVGERFACAALVRRIDVSSGATVTCLEGESTPQLSPDGRWLATIVTKSEPVVVKPGSECEISSPRPPTRSTGRRTGRPAHSRGRPTRHASRTSRARSVVCCSPTRWRPA